MGLDSSRKKPFTQRAHGELSQMGQWWTCKISSLSCPFILTTLIIQHLLIPFLLSCSCEGWSDDLFFKKRESKCYFFWLWPLRTSVNWELQPFFFITIIFFSLRLSALEGTHIFFRRDNFKHRRAPVAVLIQTLLETCRRGKTRALNLCFCNTADRA